MSSQQQESNMGRYYYGNITGKFWFGIQSSAPLKDYGATELGQFYRFKVCSCGVGDGDLFNEDEPPSKDLYCEECYESFEKHKKECEDEDEFDEDDDVVLWETDNMYEWAITRDAFNEHCVPYINQHKDLVNSIIEIEFEDGNQECEYDIKFKTDENGDELKIKSEHDQIFADYCFMKQVEKYFDENSYDECSWSAEY